MCFSEENLVMKNSPFFFTRGLAASPLLLLHLSSRPLPLANRQPAREEIIIHPYRKVDRLIDNISFNVEISFTSFPL